ncbi:MAG: hypothetical protein OHK0029_00460 [Armatimonadaceae bacterium]
MAQELSEPSNRADAPSTAARDSHSLFTTLAKFAWLVVGLVILLWFLDQTLTAIFFFAFALVLAIALNPLVTKMEQARLPRWAGTLLVVLGIGAIISGLYTLIAPRIAEQVSSLVENLPEYLRRLEDRATRLWNHSPMDNRFGSMSGQLDQVVMQELFPAAQSLLFRVGRYTMTLITGLFMLLVLFGTIVYTLVRPRPLLRGYVELFPPDQRDRAAQAFSDGSDAVVGWLRANVILGAIEAVGAAIFLPILGVPGALVWAVLTFFAELIPKIGVWFMMIPPILVSLAIDPQMALWVFIAYNIMLALTQNLVGPFVRGQQMQLHPVTVLFGVVALTLAFGILGALIATPLLAFIKAFYNQFYRDRQADDSRVDDRVEAMLTRRDVRRTRSAEPVPPNPFRRTRSAEPVPPKDKSTRDSRNGISTPVPACLQTIDFYGFSQTALNVTSPTPAAHEYMLHRTSPVYGSISPLVDRTFPGIFRRRNSEIGAPMPFVSSDPAPGGFALASSVLSILASPALSAS